VVVGDSSFSFTIADNNELAMLLDLEPQRVLYPLEPYPLIREFAAILKALKPGEQGWMGREFFGYSPAQRYCDRVFCGRVAGAR
jgi:hypothetical protein